jgi:hypothetical protein
MNEHLDRSESDRQFEGGERLGEYFLQAMQALRFVALPTCSCTIPVASFDARVMCGSTNLMAACMAVLAARVVS